MYRKVEFDNPNSWQIFTTVKIGMMKRYIYSNIYLIAIYNIQYTSLTLYKIIEQSNTQTHTHVHTQKRGSKRETCYVGNFLPLTVSLLLERPFSVVTILLSGGINLLILEVNLLLSLYRTLSFS